MAFLAPELQAPLARNEGDTCTPKVGVPAATLYARVAFLAPEPQASLARNERETLAPQKWAFSPTLQSTFYARVAFLAPELQAPLARNKLKTLDNTNAVSSQGNQLRKLKNSLAIDFVLMVCVRCDEIKHDPRPAKKMNAIKTNIHAFVLDRF